MINFDGRFLAANAAYQDMLEYSEAELQALSWMDVMHEDDRGANSGLVTELFEGQRQSFVLVKRNRRKDGHVMWVHVHASLVPGTEGIPGFIIGVVEDITEREHSEHRLATQYAITRILAESDTLDDAMPPLLQAIGERLGWEWGALWTIDQDAGVLRCEHIWHAPSLEAEALDAISWQTAGLPDRGLKGRVWQSAEPTWMADVTQDPHFMRAPIAARMGLQGAVAFPILLRGETLGIMEFFSRAIPPPDEAQLAMLSAMGNQIGQFVERKRAEEQLRRSEAYLAEGQRISHTGSWAVQLPSEDVFWSPEVYRIYGLDPATTKLSPQMAFQLIHPDDRPCVQEAFERALRENSDYAVEHRAILPDGSIKHLHALGHPVLNESGTLTEYVGTVMDITERKCTEALLRQAHERVEMILDSITDRFFAFDRDWRFTYVNKHAAAQMRVLGKDPARLIGQVLWEEFPDPTSGEHLRRAMSERVVVTDEQYYPPLGEWYENRIYPSPDGGIAVFQRYVTERKRAEEELRRANARITEILESITDAFSAWDQNWRYIYVNERAVQLLGKPGDELIGRCVWDLFPNAVGTEAYLKCQQAMTERVPLSFEAFFPGLNRWYENDVYPTKEGLSVYWRDITERKRAEEQLRRSEACLVDAQRLSHTGRWAWNVSTGALFWSQEHFRICGLDPEGVTPSYPAALACIHPEDRSVVQQALERAVRDRREFDQECRISCPDGMIRHIRSVAHPVFDASGELTEYVGTLIDTTERKQAEAAVHRAYETLEQQVRERTAALAQANVELRVEIAERRRTEAVLAQRNEELLGLYARVEQERALQATLLRELNHRVRNNLAAVLGILEIERGRAPGGPPTKPWRPAPRGSRPSPACTTRWRLGPSPR